MWAIETLRVKKTKLLIRNWIFRKGKTWRVRGVRFCRVDYGFRFGPRDSHVRGRAHPYGWRQIENDDKSNLSPNNIHATSDTRSPGRIILLLFWLATWRDRVQPFGRRNLHERTREVPGGGLAPAGDSANTSRWPAAVRNRSEDVSPRRVIAPRVSKTDD